MRAELPPIMGAVNPGGDSAGRGHLLPGFSYFEYQRIVCREVLIPWLEKRIALEGRLVGDFGAHHGGMVDALREWGHVAGAIGLELSEDVVASSPFVSDEKFRLEHADVLAPGSEIPKFDLVLLHDVLEHVPEYGRALDAIRSSLRAGGYAFISFPPYYSAFGGHQQYARGLARFTPFVHLLPARALLSRRGAGRAGVHDRRGRSRGHGLGAAAHG